MSITLYVPVYLYTDSDAAYTQDVSKRGALWSTLGPHPIANTAYNGAVVAIKHPTGGYTLGWIRVADNAQASTIQSFPDFTVGEAVTIQLNRSGSSFTHDLTVTVNGTQVWSASNVGTSVSMSLSSAQRETLYRASPSSMKPTAVLSVQTKNGGTPVGGVATKSARAEIPVSIYNAHLPQNTAVSEANTQVSALGLGSVYLQSVSELRVQLRGEGLYGSTLKRLRVQIDGTPGISVETNSPQAGVTWSGTLRNLTKSGAQDVLFQMTDSRDVTTTVRKTITVRQYVKPYAILYTPYRSNSAGNPVDTGTYAFVAGTIERSELKNASNVDKNTLTVKIQTRERGATAWTTKYTTNPTTSTYMLNKMISSYAVDKAYEILVTVSDALYTTLYQRSLPTAGVPGSWDLVGFSCGKVKEDLQYALEVGGKSWFVGDVRADADIKSAGRVTGNNLRAEKEVYSSTANIGNISVRGDVEIQGRSTWDVLLFHEPRDVSGRFSQGTGVTNFQAWRSGHTVTISFEFQPAAGWSRNVITVNSYYRPKMHVAMGVAAYNSAGDNTRSITGLVTSGGEVRLYAATAASYPVVFSATWVAPNVTVLTLS